MEGDQVVNQEAESRREPTHLCCFVLVNFSLPQRNQLTGDSKKERRFHLAYMSGASQFTTGVPIGLSSDEGGGWQKTHGGSHEPGAERQQKHTRHLPYKQFSVRELHPGNYIHSNHFCKAPASDAQLDQASMGDSSSINPLTDNMKLRG